MKVLDELVGELGGALTAVFRGDKAELSDIKKRAVETKTILHLKEDQLSELYAEHKKLTRELEYLEISSQNMQRILDELHVEEVKSKNATRIARKATKKAERVYEMNTELTQKDKEVLVKRRLTLYIIKKYLGFHVEQGPNNDLNIVSWADGTAIHSNCVKSPEKAHDLSHILWESFSRKSPHYDQWVKLFEQE